MIHAVQREVRAVRWFVQLSGLCSSVPVQWFSGSVVLVVQWFMLFSGSVVQRFVLFSGSVVQWFKQFSGSCSSVIL